ncbi:MAG: methylated-DNA--[protein]-cysteine S-methyltransferase, partial [Gemmatimonadaceae bacterium]
MTATIAPVAKTFERNTRRHIDRPLRVSNEVIDFVIVNSSIALVLVAAGENGVCAILLGDDADELRRDVRDRFPDATLQDGGADLRRIADEVSAVIETPARPIDVKFEMRGTTFQKAVWNRLCEIPVGSTVSYGDIAVSLSLPASARAVAQACAANALAVIVPCHRVVR